MIDYGSLGSEADYAGAPIGTTVQARTREEPIEKRGPNLWQWQSFEGENGQFTDAELAGIFSTPRKILRWGHNQSDLPPKPGPTKAELREAYAAWMRSGQAMHAVLLDIWRALTPDSKYMTFGEDPQVVADAFFAYLNSHPAPVRPCGLDVGTRPWWMGVDQYDPCACILDFGHPGSCHCEHTITDGQEPKGESPIRNGAVVSRSALPRRPWR